MEILTCGCTLGRERCFDCRPGLDPDQKTAIAISVARQEVREMMRQADISMAAAIIRQSKT